MINQRAIIQIQSTLLTKPKIVKVFNKAFLIQNKQVVFKRYWKNKKINLMNKLNMIKLSKRKITIFPKISAMNNIIYNLQKELFKSIFMTQINNCIIFINDQ